ncbi:MAG: DNA-cytosine methyltransferase [Bradyrhizobium sp.]|nr:DNA-cytosine methyltransferase [Bradyrhizobium sp.]
MAADNLQVVSLFSGAMGLDQGLELAGLSVAVAVECNKSAVETIRLNRPELPLLPKKIEDVPTAEILEKAGLEVGGSFVVSGGPSCQAFSTAGQRASLEDPRGGLFREFVRVVEEARPRFFVMENVRGLLSAAVKHRPLKERGPGFEPLSEDEQLGSALKVVVEELRSLNYFVTFDVVNAADYGVPQTRERLVFIGSRDGEDISIPQATHAEGGARGLKPWVTLEDVMALEGDYDPDYYGFSPMKRRFLEMVPEGGNWRDLPVHLQAEALGKAHVSWGGRSGFYRRLAWKKPSPTLNTRPDSKATSLCHPTELRPLSVGEYARIQQFPASWKFAGSAREKYQQLGNAVPLGLGEAIGKALLDVVALESTGAEDRLGRVECSNLDLLAKLSRRPLTIYNPPRMRGEDAESMGEWRDGRQIMRSDFMAYAPPDARDDLTALIETQRRKIPSRTRGPSVTLPLAAE